MKLGPIVSLALCAAMMSSVPCTAGFVVAWQFPGVQLTLPGSGLEDGYLGDIDGDGRMEIVGVDTNNYTRVRIVDAILGTTVFEVSLGSLITHNIALVDLDSDGTPEIVIGENQASGIPHYNVFAVIDWSGPPAAVPEPGNARPSLSLENLAPNPSGSVMGVRFRLSAPATVGIRVLDVQGRVVSDRFAQGFPSGSSAFDYTLTLASGEPVPAGVYFVEYSVDGRAAGVQRTVVVR